MKLPKPKADHGKSLAAALRLRKTTREMTPQRITPQVLSNVLFAACGVNRKRGPFGKSPGLTAASASNSQEIRVYVALEDGAYLFEPRRHALSRVTTADVRLDALTPHQPRLSAPPVHLVYVVDLERLEHTRGFDEPGLHDPEVQKSYYFVDTGLIAGNVYVYAAAHGLACWFHNCDKAKLARKLRLTKKQRVLFAQSIGHPAIQSLQDGRSEIVAALPV